MAVAAVTIGGLYRVSLEVRRDELRDIVHVRAALLETLTKHSTGIKEVLPLVREAQMAAPGMGRTGEFMVGQRAGDRVTFLVLPRRGEPTMPSPVAWGGPLAEPMQHALAGESGIMVGRDYRGRKVLAAYEPIHGSSLALVAKMGVAEVRAPFLWVGGAAGGFAILMVAAGALLFLRLGDPIARRIEASEQRFRSLVEHGNDVTAILAVDGTIRYQSPATRRTLGYDPGELAGTSIFELVHPDDAAYALASFQDLVTMTGERRLIELRLRHRDGSWRHLQAVGTNLVGTPGVDGLVVNSRDVTENRLAQAALEASEERYHTLFDQVPMGLYRTTPEGRYIEANQAMAEILGFPSREALMATPLDKIYADPEVRRRWQREMAGKGRLQGVEIEVLTATGDTRWMRHSTRAVLNDDGQVVAYEGAAEDITERVRAQRELLAEKDFSEAMLTSLPGVAYLIDADLRFRRWNANLETVTGYSAAELAELSPLDLFGKSDRQRVAERIAEAFASGQSTVEAGFRAKDGTTTPHSFTARRIEIGGSPILIGIGLDISTRVEAEQALASLNAELERRIAVRTAELAASERSYRIVADNTYDWEYWRLPDGTLRYVSPSCQRITGFAAGDFVADPELLLRIIHPSDREHFAVHCAGTGDGSAGQLDFRIVRPSGEVRWIGHACQPVYDGDQKWLGVRASNRDITESKEAGQSVIDLNRELSETVDKLAVANKELEAFSYSVSHDLRAPLRSIDGFSRILLEEYAGALPEEGQRYLGIVRDSTVKMGQLIDDLLAFSRLGRRELRRETTDVGVVVGEVIDDLAPELDGRNVEWTVGELRPCHADPQLLEVVLTNLIGNALKFTRRRDPARIEVGCRTSEGETVYFVKDNGAGFDMAYADKLFGVFQRLHREEDFPGTGVGLATCRRIISRHGGRMWADAAPDEGATFSFIVGEGS